MFLSHCIPVFFPSSVFNIRIKLNVVAQESFFKPGSTRFSNDVSDIQRSPEDPNEGSHLQFIHFKALFQEKSIKKLQKETNSK